MPRRETDDTPRTIPESLVPASVRLFGLEAMPAEQVRRSTVYRCVAGRVLVCNLGANLPCGKAKPAVRCRRADAWCAENRGIGFHPDVRRPDTTRSIAGAATGQRPTAIGEPLEVDRRGFIARLWKPVDEAAEPRR